MNEYSPTWFETFLGEAGPPVARELDFLDRHAPLPTFRRVLDVACGTGRHARALARRGYEVTGIDRSEVALRVARAGAPGGARFLMMEMEALEELHASFDLVLCLWQSFGYGDDEANARVLRTMVDRVRRGGRVLLDVYNRDALREGTEESTEERNGRTVHTVRTLGDERYRVVVTYGGSSDRDVFDWRVYRPAEMEVLLAACGLRTLVDATWFDENRRPGPQDLRMQWLAERV